MQFPNRKSLAAVAIGGAFLAPATATAAPLPTGTAAGHVDPVLKLADRAHDRAADRHMKLHRINVRLKGRRPDADRRKAIRDWTIPHLRERNAEMRRENRKLRRQARAAAAAAPAASTGAATGGAASTAPSGGAPAGLEAIAACESGGDPTAVDATGTYRGKYQFDQQTWQSVGGTGDPAAAPEAEQDARAAQLAAQRGSSPWPVCGG